MRHEENMLWWDLEDCSEDDLPCHHSSLQILVLIMTMIKMCILSNIGPTWGQYRSWEDGCDGNGGHAELCPLCVSPGHWHWHHPRLLLSSPQGREVWTEQEMISLIAITGNKGDAITTSSPDTATTLCQLSICRLYLWRTTSDAKGHEILNGFP